MAERLLGERLADESDLVSVASAGTRALVGYGMDEASAGVLRALGVDPGRHVARQLTSDLVTDADLVLTADTANRAIVLRDNPIALRRVFTMREFARLGAALGPLPERTEEALRKRISEVAAQRGLVPPPEPGEEDIADPFRAPLAVVQRCGAQLQETVAGIVAALGL